MLNKIIKRLDNLESTKDEISKLTLRNVSYCIVAHWIYELVGEGLLWSLEHTLGSTSNNEIKTAWAVYYIMLSNAMIEACELVEL